MNVATKSENFADGRGRRPPALRGAAQDLPDRRARHLPAHQVGAAARHARHLLPAALRALGPRAERSLAGGAGRPRQWALLLLLHRDLAAGDLLRHRSPDPRRAGAVPDERGGRAHLVRLSVPADRVDRPVPGHRAPGRGRPAPAPREAQERLQGPARLRGRGQALPLADGGVVDRRRLGALLRRRADPDHAAPQGRGADGRLSLDRHSHLHHLCARWPPARAGMHLYVPLAAHPGGADG